MPIEYHDYLIQIEPDTVLWRYMDFDKFLSLLETRCLFFCRADKFSDPFEGTTPKREVEYRPVSYQQICEFYKTPFDLNKFNKNEASTIDFNKRTRIGTIVNSWHINNHESEPMWRLYLKTNEGVAIQTNSERIINSFKETEQAIYPSKVRYIDYNTEIWYHEIEYPYISRNSLTPFIHKRIEYKSENEFRLFHIVKEVIFYQGEQYWISQKKHIGSFIKVDVEQLIEKVIFPPNLNEQEKNRIKEKTIELGYCLNFKNSSLEQAPCY